MKRYSSLLVMVPIVETGEDARFRAFVLKGLGKHAKNPKIGWEKMVMGPI